MRQAWRLFDRMAGDYDQVMPIFHEFGKAIVAAVDPPAGCRFLDLGAGRGALTSAALHRGCAVTAVDAAPEMARRLVHDHPGAAVCVMDAGAMGFKSGEFDLVMASFVIHLLDDPGAGVTEAFRVLRPGGRCVLTGGSARHHDEAPVVWSSPLTDRVDMLFLEFAPLLPPGGGIGRPIDAAGLLEAAGFVDLREDHATVEITVPHTQALWRWSMTSGYRGFVEALPGAHRAEFEQRMLGMSIGDGLLRRRTCLWSGRRPA
ncbi:class I SAM-dependent methyltransferase [Actinoplanes couchii]|uniref:class I SAM-dependent methyltransferase n=1 Tax=Actinoplanes couchii TaxID=403638 RepID=UPI001942EA54|nr:class I SAM-dependent methyltransferase [Actinoplanes couchii]MDR6320796.1 SAM-dependent methyltransferase [Actinoplanes couchii]